MKKTKLPTLTLTIIRSWNPCYDPVKWYPESWSGTTLTILEDKRIPASERIWCVLRKEAGIDDKTLRLFACWCAREALKLIPEKEIDPRSVKAIDVAEKFAVGKATEKQLEAAWAAAWAAARAAARGAQVRKLISMLKA